MLHARPPRLLPILGAAFAICFLAAPALAQSVRDSRPAQLREKVAQLQRRILAVSNLQALTPESVIAALGANVAPPEMVTSHRREWALRASDLYSAGTIAQAGNWAMVEVVPAAELQISFEDLAGGLLDLPYYSETRQAHVGEDSVASRVYAIDHVFLVPAGQLRLQVPTSVPENASDQTVKALREGFATTRGLNSRTVPVTKILINNRAATPNDSMKPLAERRKRPRPKAAVQKP